MDQDVGVSLSRFSSPYHQRELRTYLRYVLRRVDAGALITAARGGMIARRSVGRPPRGLQLGDDPATPVRASSPCAPPLTLATAGSGTASLDAIDLATRSWDLNGGAPWTGRFDDPEDAYAAHRFGWSLPLLSDHRGIARVVELASAWLEAHPAREGAAGWDSYSVAERLVHWIYLIAAIEMTGRDEAARLTAAVAGHAAWLRAHLELRGEATNNHLINDARALYAAAALLGDDGLAAQARDLLTFATPRMFVGGFLREGSSDYQRLMCRTYAEMLTAARAAGDREFAERLCEWLAAITAALEFLPAVPMFPLIGDVSPDSGCGDSGSVVAVARSSLGDAGRANAANPAEAGFYRFDRGPWSVTAYVNPLGYVPAWSHGHADLGAFIAAWSGQPFLIDTGRATYRATAIGSYGRSVRSHNGVSIDRHEPCVTHGHNGFVPLLQPTYYASPRPRVDVVNGETASLRIEHYGFTRLSSGLVVTRTLALSASELAVQDEVNGRGMRCVETFFHFHPRVRVTVASPSTVRAECAEGVLLLQGPQSADVDHCRGQMDPYPAGWYAGRYGSLEPCSTIVFTTRAALPIRQRFIIRSA